MIVKFRGIFLPLVFVQKETATHSKILLFSDSFALWLQATEASYTVDCSIVAMLAIKKSKFLNAFSSCFLGLCLLPCFLFKI